MTPRFHNRNKSARDGMRNKGTQRVVVRHGFSRAKNAGSGNRGLIIIAISVSVLILITGGVYLWTGDGGDEKTEVEAIESTAIGKTKSNKKRIQKKNTSSLGIQKISADYERITQGFSGRDNVLTATKNVGSDSETGVIAESTDTKTPPTKSVFTNTAEELLLMAFPSNPGDEVPPLPVISDEELENAAKAALRNVHMARAEDGIGIVNRKVDVEMMKQEYGSLQKDGWSFRKYLEELRKKQNDDAKFIAEAHEVDSEAFGDVNTSDEDYLKVRGTINEALRNRGLPELEPLANEKEKVL